MYKKIFIVMCASFSMTHVMASDDQHKPLPGQRVAQNIMTAQRPSVLEQVSTLCIFAVCYSGTSYQDTACLAANADAKSCIACPGNCAVKAQSCVQCAKPRSHSEMDR